MTKISSSTDLAERIVNRVLLVDVQSSKKVVLRNSTITSIRAGVEINNNLLSELSKLTVCVKEQSNKIPEIARLMEICDNEFILRENK